MPLNLESFYVIDEWGFSETELVIRLVPDFLNVETIEPVVTVSIFEPHSKQDAESSLASYADEMIVDIQVAEGRLELWGEYDEGPLSISGNEVRVTRSAYSSRDLAKAIVQLQSQLSSSQADSIRLRKHINEVEQFVVDLLSRAHAKKAMSSRSTSPSDAQIDALSRVLSHLRDAPHVKR